MTPQEIIKEIRKLPPMEQKIIKDSLESVKDNSLPSEDAFIQLLLADGVISEIPDRVFDPEFEDYEPIVVQGEPLSEMIIRERR